MRLSLLAVALPLLAAGLFGPAPAEAQGSEADARRYFEQGSAALEAGANARAAELFERSAAISERASTLCNLALSYERLERFCDARSRYRRCAELDQEGRFREPALVRVAELEPQCQPSAAEPSEPPVIQAAPRDGADVSGSVSLRVVDSTGPGQGRDRATEPDATLVGFGAASLALAAVAFGVGVGAAVASNDQAAGLPPPPADLIAGSEDADRLQRASQWADAAIGLYVASGVLGALGATLVIIGLANQRPVDRADRGQEPSFALDVGPEGARGHLRIAF